MKTLIALLLAGMVTLALAADVAPPEAEPESGPEYFVLTIEQLQIIQLGLQARDAEILKLRAQLRNGQGCI